MIKVHEVLRSKTSLTIKMSMQYFYMQDFDTFKAFIMLRVLPKQLLAALHKQPLPLGKLCGTHTLHSLSTSKAPYRVVSSSHSFRILHVFLSRE